MKHTLSLSMKLSCWEQYKFIISRFYDYARKHGHNYCFPLDGWESKKMAVEGEMFTALTKYGITMRAVTYSGAGYVSYIWEIKINPNSRYGIDRISVADENDVKVCFDMLDFFLQHKLGIPCDHGDFNINRLDCAYNHFSESTEILGLYMSLMKKANIPHDYEHFREYNDFAHRTIKPKDAIYCCNSSRTVTINIYNKALQLAKDKYIDENYDLSQANGLMRIEVQISRQKLVGYQKLLRVNSLHPEAYIKDCFSFYVLKYYMKELFRTGDYYTFAVAKEKISNSNFHYPSKEMMVQMLELTSTRNGLKNAIKEMLAMGYTQKSVFATLERFDSLHINPVTIPIIKAREHNINFLPSPINLLH